MIAFAGFIVVVATALAATLLLQPSWLVETLARRSPDALYRVDTHQPLIALTIDDGPDPGTTPAILAALERQRARATFFLIGDRVRRHPDLVRRIVRDGHEIGNHMMRDRPSHALPPEEFRRALSEADSILADFGEVGWWRPGSGWLDARMAREAAELGYRTALGSIYPYDGSIGWSAYSTWLVLRRAEPGAIVILHDGGPRGRRTARVLNEVLPRLADRGLRGVTLSRLAAGSVDAAEDGPPGDGGEAPEE